VLVEIRHVRQSCDCADVVVPAGVVEPGKSVTLACRWDTRGKRGPSATELEVVASEAGKNERRGTVLTLRADVVPDYTYSPEELVFHSDRPETLTVAVRPAWFEDLTLLSAAADHRAFDATLNAKKSEVSVTFDPAQWYDARGAVSLVVQTNSPRHANFQIPLRVSRAAPAQPSVDSGETPLAGSP
jgi:hypothetical protein